MNSSPALHFNDSGEIATYLNDILSRMRASFVADAPPSLEQRVGRIKRLMTLIQTHKDRIVEEEQKDFKDKSEVLIRAAEIMGFLQAAQYTLDNIEGWMQPEPYELPPHLADLGARAESQCQPLGVVGIIGPWNAPILLSFLPLLGAFAAGNRAMIKPSSETPHMAALLPKIVAEFFDETEVVVVSAQKGVSVEFAKLPFDHLVFTGSTATGKQVMKAAAENLVPVTLEMGGKSPAIVGESANMPLVSKRMVYGKLMHGGQICVTPDYLYVPESKLDDFIRLYVKEVAQHYPEMVHGADYSPVVNEKNFHRLQNIVAEASGRGARVIEINPAGEKIDPAVSLKFPLHLIINPSDDMAVMQEEIFGPVLVIKTYNTLDEVLAYINGRDRPLAAYYFGEDEVERDRVIASITCGSMVINDSIYQIFFEQFPFGGVGASGIGRYRGQAGFKNFSNIKMVMFQTNVDEALQFMRPPYGEGLSDFIAQQLGEK